MPTTTLDAQTRLKVYYEFKVPTIITVIAGPNICRRAVDFLEIQTTSVEPAPYGAQLSTESDTKIAYIIAVVERP
jgi:hypothetical protein